VSRGLGTRQRAILEQLAAQPGRYVPLHELADAEGLDDPDERRNEMAKARAAVRSLERRGLVKTIRGPDHSHLIDTTVIVSAVGSDLRLVYYAEANVRAWHGLWACLRDPGDNEPLPELETVE
jgi:hypothetical protein